MKNSSTATTLVLAAFVSLPGSAAFAEDTDGHDWVGTIRNEYRSMYLDKNNAVTSFSTLIFIGKTVYLTEGPNRPKGQEDVLVVKYNCKYGHPDYDYRQTYLISVKNPGSPVRVIQKIGSDIVRRLVSPKPVARDAAEQEAIDYFANNNGRYEITRETLDAAEYKNLCDSMPSLSADATNLKPTPPDGYIKSVETEFDIRYFNPSSVKEAKPGVYSFVSYAFQTKKQDKLRHDELSKFVTMFANPSPGLQNFLYPGMQLIRKDEVDCNVARMKSVPVSTTYPGEKTSHSFVDADPDSVKIDSVLEAMEYSYSPELYAEERVEMQAICSFKKNK